MSQTDDGDNEMNSSVENSATMTEDHPCEKDYRSEEIALYKDIISKKYRANELMLNDILRKLQSSREIGDERVLLGSIAFFTVLREIFQPWASTNNLLIFLNLRQSCLRYRREFFHVADLVWFKLAMFHGYLQLNIENVDPSMAMKLSIEILGIHCLTYTKYSHVAYKILQTCMKKLEKLDFWLVADTIKIEHDLETIIFSNWDNCISEISRINANEIFSIYLRIMSRKYENFLHYIYENCVQNISWQNVKKYTILLETCKIFDDLSTIVASNLPACIFTSLTRNHLKHPGTLLYLTILNKLEENYWQMMFGEDFFRISAEWESRKETTAIGLLWEQWMKPTMEKFRNVFEYLWNHPLMSKLRLSQSYFLKIADQLSFKLPLVNENFRYILNNCIVDISEIVRLNTFAIICQNENWQLMVNEVDPFVVVKRFFYFNANASTIYMRKGIIDNFKIFFANMMKLAHTEVNTTQHVIRFVEWFHEFLLDCFEIGSSYQRKILGLSLYQIILNFTTDNFVDGLSMKTTKFEATLKASKILRQKMERDNCWKFTDRHSAIVILKLVLDQMADVRKKSASIMTRYFQRDVFLEIADVDVFSKIASRHCDTSRFNEISAGSAFIGILVHFGLENNLMNVYLAKARCQLDEMRSDILKAVAGGSSFFSALTIILEVGLTNESTETPINDHQMLKILDLVEEATNFFLATFSVKNKDNEYLPSFEEMSLAIEASIRNSEIDEENEECVLSPAHQLVVSCIWMSLKVSCDLAAEIGRRVKSEENVIRAVNVIVSVLLKCRHKGAIEAAGLAISKLTKTLCNDNPSCVKHLEKFLLIDKRENVNLTRRGAGLTIMFHRIVSSDHRRHRPLLHFAMSELLTSLKIERNEIGPNDGDYLADLPCARHLHCLRALIADKSLHGHLVTYMDTVCLICFEHLQSSDWSVRNASLQLFGAIVPRLVGQCNDRELDYATGNSIYHFITHYPDIGNRVMLQLEQFVRCFNWRKNLHASDVPIANNLVPILTLLSKMSASDCEIIDCSAFTYTRRGSRVFYTLLGHPMFHVRLLAAKAYAAFIRFPNILKVLARLRLDKKINNNKNHNHGRLLAQYYLERKYEHETLCTSNRFIVRSHAEHEADFLHGTRLQLEQESITLASQRCKDPGILRATSFELERETMHSTLLRCLLDSRAGLSLIRDFYHFEFPDYMITHWKHFNSYCSFARNIKLLPYSIYHLIVDSLRIFDDKSKSHKLLDNVAFISNLLREKNPNDETRSSMSEVYDGIFRVKLSELTDMLRNIDESRPFLGSKRLRFFGHVIAIDKSVKVDTNVLDSTLRYLHEKMNLANDVDVVETKNLVIACLSRLISKIYRSKDNCFADMNIETIKFFILIATTLLTDEDSETRELSSKLLFPLVQCIIPAYKTDPRPICARANLHEILIAFSIDNRTNYIFDIIGSIVKAMDVTTETSSLRSPYEQDDTYHRDYTGLMNLIFYCIMLSKNSKWLTGINDYCEFKHVDSIIRSKYEFQRLAGVEMKNFDEYAKLSMSDYLSCKKRVLMKIVDDETFEKT